ncbi:protein ALTERED PHOSPHATEARVATION RESPONSE 1-like [Populus alba x Populus x berolinensis]|uniref:Protein ALTERED PHOSPHATEARVATION RESPONSE 1-like n=1 Tax=Populus alba x Populus x berolinensis TaxID=444605 RepID=A0AAD6W2T6_9ROSI|nr:protein ALTERED PHOSPHATEARVATION RESPONSE 1-like [Populus alba x Populus x berolinensis]
MGCCYSRIEREEMVSRCKARKRYMKQYVKARQSLSVSHAMYIRSLRSTGSALLQFSNNESDHHLRLPPIHPSPPPLPPTPPPPPPPPMSPSSDTWTTTTTTTAASPLPPPPPPPVAGSSWDFWDPFVPPPPVSVEEEEWEEVTTTITTSEMVAVAPPSVASRFPKENASGSGSELAMVVSRNSKDLVEIIKEVDEYFLKAADAGGQLSRVLEVSSPNLSARQGKGGRVYNYGCNLTSPSSWTWGSSPKLDGFGKMSEEMVVSHVGSGGVAHVSHCSTVERLYAWEKKLFIEVKNAESLKIEHEKKVALLRKLEARRADYVKTEKMKKEVEKLESQLMVATQGIETTSAEIIKLRETELYPQLLELVKGLMCMWRGMYESHQVQTHIVQQLKYLNAIPSTEPTTEIHRQSTLQFEFEVQQWHHSFCNVVKAQRDYIQSLTGWLRLSLFQFSKNPISRTSQESRIYSLCEEWNHAVDRIPDKVASEGIKSFLTVIHAIVVQQTEEHKQKKKSESAFKEFEKKVAELRSLESKYGPYSMPEASSTIRIKDPVTDKRAKVEILRARAEEEKSKHEKLISVTRSVTSNNLQMGFPHAFQAMVGFSSVCMNVFESVYNQAKNADQEHDVKREQN